MALPQLTPEQRAQALDAARVARTVRAALLKQLKTGEVTLTELLARAQDPADEHKVIIGKTKVVAVVLALPGVGKIRAAELMSSIDVSESRRVQGLGAAQRKALLAAVGQD